VTVDGVRAEFVADPALVHRILVKDAKRYGKGELFRKARNLSRVGLLADDAAVHRHYRRLAHPQLRTAAVVGHAPLMRDIARDAVASWRPGQAVDVQTEMCRIAGAIALSTLLPGLTPAQSAALTERLTALSWEMIRKPLYGRAAARASRQRPAARLARVREDFRTPLAAALAGRTCPADAGPDYVSALASDPGRGGAPALTADQICDEAVMLLTAATVTTASVLSWALHVLSEEPLIEEKVLKDLAQEGDGNRYTLRFLTEVMRLHPPVWISCRRALTDVELGGNSYPAGTHILFSSYLLHRNPGSHPDPHRFDPDRWLTHRPAPGEASYIPFGIGAKGCIGESFAWQELQTILSAVIQEWQLAPADGHRIRTAAETTLHPRRLRLIPRPR
jgi:pentalenene oxygenase